LQSETSIRIPVVSASSCITKGDFWAMPPTPISRSMRTPLSRMWSRICFVAKAVASANA